MLGEVTTGKRRIWMLLAATIACVAMAIVCAPRAQAGTFHWTPPVTIDRGTSLTGVSCTSSSFCAAIDETGHILTSTNPFVANPTWSVSYTDDAGYNENPDDGGHLTAISCFGGQAPMCAVTDDAADVLTSNDPSAESPNWNVVPALTSQPSTSPGLLNEPGEFLNSISCASQTLCVTTDGAELVFASTDPFSSSPTWTYASGNPLFNASGQNHAVSCATADLCVIAEGGGVAISIDPGTVPTTWTSYGTPDGALQQAATAYIPDIACPSADLCVTDDSDGGILTSKDPGEAQPKYVRDHVDASNVMHGMSCLSASVCAATDAVGNVILSSDASAASPTWKVTKAGTYPLNDVSCVSDTQCVAVDTYGDAIASSTADLAPPPPVIAAPTAYGEYSTASLPRLKYTCAAATGQKLATGTKGCSAFVNAKTKLATGAALPKTTGSNTVVVTATDTDGLSTTTTVTYTVFEAPPSAKFGKATKTSSSASVKVTCPAGGVTCGITGGLFTTAKHRKLLGKTTAKIASKASRTITVKLSKAGVVELRKQHQLKLILYVAVDVDGGYATNQQKVTLTAPKKKAKHRA